MRGGARAAAVMANRFERWVRFSLSLSLSSIAAGCEDKPDVTLQLRMEVLPSHASCVTVCRTVCDAARHLHSWCTCGVLVGAFRVETKIDEAVAVTMSFDGSENIIVLPDNGVCAAPLHALY